MRNPIVALRDERSSRGQHAGLLLQRYLSQQATGEGGNPEERLALLRSAISASNCQEVRELYSLAFERWCAGLPNSPGPLDFETEIRLIVGFGVENVLETGIQLHHNYGMPIIPGSAIKGLASHYCDQVWAKADARFKKPKDQDKSLNAHSADKNSTQKHNYHSFLFGTTSNCGCLIFHDAWYVPNSSHLPLALDVLTPHHPKWLDGSRDSGAPTDFDSPTPIPFLSATGRYRVAITWHGPLNAERDSWIQLGLELVKQAIADWGVGGKTSSGYGRLRVCNSPTVSQTSGPDDAQLNSGSPIHDKGKKIRVTQRTIGGKVRYEADDGCFGSLIKGVAPDIEDGESTELWILRVDVNNRKVPYVFQIDEPKVTGSRTSRKQRPR